MIEIYLLEQLEAFARNGTLLAASEELHITQPALSRNMKKLEEEFGVSLFHRENSKISLNKNGKLAVEYARKVLEDDQDKDAVTYTLNQETEIGCWIKRAGRSGSHFLEQTCSRGLMSISSQDLN